VTIPSFTLTIEADDQQATVEVKDGCAVITSDDRTVDSCESGKDITKAFDEAGLGDDASPEVKELVTTVQDAFADFQGTGIAVDRVDGTWYVSPIATGFDSFNAVLGALDSDELQDIIDAAKKIDAGGLDIPQIATGSGSTADTIPFPDDTSVDTAPTSGNTVVPETFPTDDSVAGAHDTVEFRLETEEFINSSEVAAQLGFALSQASCETPTSTAIGTTYTCTAWDSAGTKFSLGVEITSADGFTIQSADPA
jgi:hypothetical protein